MATAESSIYIVFAKRDSNITERVLQRRMHFKLKSLNLNQIAQRDIQPATAINKAQGKKNKDTEPRADTDHESKRQMLRCQNAADTPAD
eukprot:5161-Heterococcus_DN1.PRE.1